MAWRGRSERFSAVYIAGNFYGLVGCRFGSFTIGVLMLGSIITLPSIIRYSVTDCEDEAFSMPLKQTVP